MTRYDLAGDAAIMGGAFAILLGIALAKIATLWLM